ncbi:hypothetical protein HU200_054966 [Digitaria exilis]|uniref:Uncharacterized protein n=1 Tax=Digitaria exilis TaxID=1010633 RepID=A0A835E245_9POAL|nr:hypothetical protein HU200_054966 [Digitaria exilis]
MQDWEQCNFFQWIDGPEKVDERILLFRPSSSKNYESFQRWLPPPPNPPPMTNEEKKEVIARRLETPPLCHCGDPAQIHRTVKNCSFIPTFGCRNRTEGGYPLCSFSEYDYGPKSYWPMDEEGSKKKEKERCIAPNRLCYCGIKANYGVVPSELEIGDYRGHMVGDDLVSFVFYFCMFHTLLHFFDTSKVVFACSELESVSLNFMVRSQQWTLRFG